MRDLIEELASLISEVREPIIRYRLNEQMDKLREEKKRRTKSLHLVQSAIAQLRLDMKYLQFDLESTRQERDEALKQ